MRFANLHVRVPPNVMWIMRSLWLAVLLCVVPLWGQQHPTFEVASVKPHEGEIPPSGGKTTLSGNRLTITTYSPLGLIFYAYDLKLYQIANVSILDHTFYDITGAPAGDVTLTKDDARLMMQALLADRFKLQFHRESRDAPVYALVVGKGGSKFKESASDTDTNWTISNDGSNTSEPSSRKSRWIRWQTSSGATPILIVPSLTPPDSLAATRSQSTSRGNGTCRTAVTLPSASSRLCSSNSASNWSREQLQSECSSSIILRSPRPTEAYWPGGNVESAVRSRSRYGTPFSIQSGVGAPFRWWSKNCCMRTV